MDALTALSAARERMDLFLAVQGSSLPARAGGRGRAGGGGCSPGGVASPRCWKGRFLLAGSCWLSL